MFARLIFSETLYSKIGHRFKKYFYPFFTLKKVDEMEMIILFNWEKLSFDSEFHEFLRKNNPNIRIILILTGTINLSSNYFQKIGLKLSDVLDLFDSVYTFDVEDSKKYNIGYLPLMYAVKTNENINEKYDLCYVGNAKGRLDYIHRIYEKAVEHGLKCKFFINGVKRSEMKFKGITYNKRISYGKSIKISKESKCILELIQDGQSSSTIRMCEAIVFNKKIITNNSNIINEYYYDDNYIFIVDNISNEFVRFVKRDNIYIVNPYKNILLSLDLISFLDRNITQ
ncbi:MAG: hypothetical protein K9K32_07820 [Halanaerobiales bacterium]|nr:hypothetical protein [Halanaerobiales bacterium]